MNRPMPQTYRRRRPSTSARRPAGARHAANTMAYNEMTQVRSVTEAPGKLLCRSVIARLTTVASRIDRKIAPAASVTTTG